MNGRRQLEFFLLRYVPNAVKEEFVNFGILMLEPGADGGGFAEVRLTRDWRRIYRTDPDADVDILQSLERDIRSQLGNPQDREKLMHKLQDQFSGVVQLSSRKACLAIDPAKEMEVLAQFYLEDKPREAVPRVATGRHLILQQAREMFEQAGAWGLLDHHISVARYTRAGDPLTFDFGYAIRGVYKLFHAVALKNSVDQAISLASRYPAIAAAMTEKKAPFPVLTAIIEDNPGQNEQIDFAKQMLKSSDIKIARVSELPAIATIARQELKA